MLSRILEEIRSAGSAVNLEELSRRLEVERSALEGMIDHLVRQGKLQDDAASAAADLASAAMPACARSSCGGSCSGPKHCPFAAKLPRTFSLVSDQSDASASYRTGFRPVLAFRFQCSD